MDEIVFADKSKVPTEKELKSVLKENFVLFSEIIKHIEDNIGSISIDWKFYSKKYGWTLKCLLKKRNLFFLSPRDNFFYLTFVFGDKAVKVIESSSVSTWIIDELVAAKKYAEGRGIQLQVDNKKILKDIFKLLDIKVAN